MSAPKILRDRELSGSRHRIAAQKLYSSEAYVKKLDLAQVLPGHSGCVNTLDWSPDGHYLVSGSDDAHVILWDAHKKYTAAKAISTGHLRNIFSVKFVPHSANHTLVSASGDKTIRVFDVDYGAGSSQVMMEPCVRTIYSAHYDRVKRLVMEDDGHSFLSCSEDGDIRSFDLRQRISSRAPLISYAKYQIDLNTVAVSKVNPYLLAAGGSHPCAFLHDRRMLGRDLRAEWGSIPTKASAPTQCVKKFRSSKPPGNALGEHITCLRFSSVNPKELVISWSCDAAYLFDIHGMTERSSSTVHAHPGRRAQPTSSTSQKRKRADSPLENPLSNIDGLDCYDVMHAGRDYLLNPPFFDRDYSAALINFKAAHAVAVGRLPISGCCTDLVEHLQVIEDLLKALAWEDQFVDEFPEWQNWRHNALRYIICVLGGRADELNEHRVDVPDAFSEVPIIDITSSFPAGEPRILFPNYEAMIRSFNLTFNISKTTPPVQSPTAHRFWVEKVCRAILKSCDDDIAKIQRPEIAIDQERHFHGDHLTNMAHDLYRLRHDDDEDYRIDSEDESDDECLDDDEDFFEDDYLGHYEGEFGYIDINYGEEDDCDDALPDLIAVHDEELENDDDDEDDEDEDGDGYENGSDSDDNLPHVMPMSSFQDEYQADIESAVDRVNSGVPVGLPLRSYVGAINVETVKDVNFFGAEDEYIMSGSDDGLLFIWNKETGKIVTVLQGDANVVNVMEGHPHDGSLAVSGIDDTVKLFKPFEAQDQLQWPSRKCALDPEHIIAANAAQLNERIMDQRHQLRIPRNILRNLTGGTQDLNECRMQ